MTGYADPTTHPIRHHYIQAEQTLATLGPLGGKRRPRPARNARQLARSANHSAPPPMIERRGRCGSSYSPTDPPSAVIRHPILGGLINEYHPAS